ncbi:MAG: transposase [Prevotellaceae bacterium]|nr:transposase [Prevotellaceae bacterium]
MKMIVETNTFRDFDNASKFCCHAGVAPFWYDSGSSIRSRCRVSHKADKSTKTLLHIVALVVATRVNGELRDYYVRKVAKGKNKILILNAMRTKLARSKRETHAQYNASHKSIAYRDLLPNA